MKKGMKLKFVFLVLISFFAIQLSAQDERINAKMIKFFADAEIKIEHLRKKSPVDWKEIKKQYNATIPIVMIIDKLDNTNYKSEMDAAFDKCLKGEDVKVNQQIFAKGLQCVAVSGIRHKITKLGITKQRVREIKGISLFIEGIRPTFIRRDQTVFGGKRTLEAEVEKILTEMNKNAEKGSPALFTDIQRLEKLITRVYALSVIFEIEGIEKYRASNKEKCDVKLKEAEIFYRIIEKQVKQRNPNADKIIKSIFKVDFNNMDSKVVRKALENSLPQIKL